MISYLLNEFPVYFMFKLWHISILLITKLILPVIVFSLFILYLRCEGLFDFLIISCIEIFFIFKEIFTERSIKLKLLILLIHLIYSFIRVHKFHRRSFRCISIKSIFIILNLDRQIRILVMR